MNRTPQPRAKTTAAPRQEAVIVPWDKTSDKNPESPV